MCTLKGKRNPLSNPHAQTGESGRLLIDHMTGIRNKNSRRKGLKSDREIPALIPLLRLRSSNCVEYLRTVFHESRVKIANNSRVYGLGLECYTICGGRGY